MKTLDGIILQLRRPGGRSENAVLGGYLPSSLVVVEVHGRTRVLPGFQRVDKLLGDGLAKDHVVAAATPEPAMAACKGGSMCLSQLKKKKVISEQALRAALTPLSVPAVVAPAVVKVAEAAVPG